MLKQQQKVQFSDKDSLFESMPVLEDIFVLINDRLEDVEKRLQLVEKMSYYNEEYFQLIRDEQSQQNGMVQKSQQELVDIVDSLQRNYQTKQNIQEQQSKDELSVSQDTVTKIKKEIEYNLSQNNQQFEALQKQIQLVREQKQTATEKELARFENKLESGMVIKKHYRDEIQNSINSLKDTMCQVIDLVIRKGMNDDIEKEALMFLKKDAYTVINENLSNQKKLKSKKKNSSRSSKNPSQSSLYQQYQVENNTQNYNENNQLDQQQYYQKQQYPQINQNQNNQEQQQQPQQKHQQQYQNQSLQNSEQQKQQGQQLYKSQQQQQKQSKDKKQKYQQYQYQNTNENNFNNNNNNNDNNQNDDDHYYSVQQQQNQNKYQSQYNSQQ